MTIGYSGNSDLPFSVSYASAQGQVNVNVLIKYSHPHRPHLQSSHTDKIKMSLKDQVKLKHRVGTNLTSTIGNPATLSP